jgi:alcohol dehydrogenase class IV
MAQCRNGLDALTHGIEAYVSLGHNQLTDHHALRAVVMVIDNLSRTIDQPQEMGARVLMAQAALEAGLAFTNAILGAAHAMSHQVGGLLDLPHGVINGILLPHVIGSTPRRTRLLRHDRQLPATGGRASRRPRPHARWPTEVARLAADVGVPVGWARSASAPTICRALPRQRCRTPA